MRMYSAMLGTGLIIKWVDSLEHKSNDPNYHLSELSKSIKGKSCIFDISQTDFTKYITEFQSISEVSSEILPDFIHNIIDRISLLINLPKEHIFLFNFVDNFSILFFIISIYFSSLSIKIYFLLSNILENEGETYSVITRAYSHKTPKHVSPNKVK